jgi:hypothetical protein
VVERMIVVDRGFVQRGRGGGWGGTVVMITRAVAPWGIRDDDGPRIAAV